MRGRRLRTDYVERYTRLRPATKEDLPFIREYIAKFRLDDEDLDYAQFVVAEDGRGIAGFGRVRPHGKLSELGCVGVVEDRRGRGIGSMLVKRLIDVFPTPEVYITTDMPEYFARFGFEKLEPGPGELVEKLARVCKSKCRSDAVVMMFRKSHQL